jgi:HSP20 family protein
MAMLKFANGNTNKVLKPAFNDVFESFLNADPFLSKSNLSRNPAVNIAEDDNEFHIELAAPGLIKEDFKINLEKNLLSVSAERSEEEDETVRLKKYNRLEYNYSSFMRTFTLPDSADHAKIRAEYKDGILFITINKREEAKILSREIAIS